MPSPTRAAHESYLLADARCDWPEGVSAQRDPGCKAEGAKVTRAPHTVLWDRLEDTMTLGDVPGGCTPEKILNSRGLHVLLCRAQGTTEVWTRTAKTPWAHEAVLEVAASRVAGISSSEDGTVVLHGECDTTGCAPSHIRQPRASGVLDVWAAIDVPQSLTVLPLLAGNALVASQRGDQTSALQLWLVEEGKSLLFLTEVPRINEPLYAISMTDTSRQIALHPGDPLTTKTSVVQGDGTLLAP